MVQVASQQPTSFLSGFSSDANFQPLDLCGVQNPFFYHVFSDDFDQNDSVTTLNTYTIGGTTPGTPTLVVGADGGAISIPTTAAALSETQIQVVRASFTVNAAPKKIFFLTRLQLSLAATSNFVAGLMNIQGNAYVTPTDGVYFKWIGGTGLTINSTVTSVTTSVTVPAAAYTMANTTNIDLAFAITRLGDILAYVDTQLVGYVPQSNIGTTNGPQNAGAVARITAPTLTAVALSPTLAIQTANSSVDTLQADFLAAMKER
jgi:hypothetical protein